MIPFHEPYITGLEISSLKDAINQQSFSGAGYFTRQCEQYLKEFTDCTGELLLASSGTHALEMSALLLDLQPGDEIIMPSFTFVSSANAFVLRGAKIVFVDIRPDTMNIDERLIEKAITNKTKAILVMHYGGVACEMDTITAIAKNHGLKVIEDAAQCIDAWYKGKHLGTIGDFGAISFHASKNIHCGEGGALLVNNQSFSERAEILREKGTNRKAFLRGDIDKYSWVDIGSSYLMSDLAAAFLLPQLQSVKLVTEKRRSLWHYYHDKFMDKNMTELFQLPISPGEAIKHNAHIFYIHTKTEKYRSDLIKNLKAHKIQAYFHYVPLHTSTQGKKHSRFSGKDTYSSFKSNTLLRFPLFFDLTTTQIDTIVDIVYDDFTKKLANISLKNHE